MKHTWKKLSAWLLTAAMLLTMMPAMGITASAAETPLAEVRYSTDGGSTWNEDSLMNALWNCYSSQNVKIELLRDITLDSGWYAQQDLGYNGATWTIDGMGYTIKRAEGAKMLFCVRYGSNVTLSNITIDGGAVWEGDDPATRTNTGLSLENTNSHLIYVDGGATLTLNSGVILQNSDLGASSYGAAVVVGYYGDGNGKLIMNDGVIIRNNRAESGGAILVMDSADAFVMNGGKITGNYATSDGGAVSVYGGSFVMNDGEISKNASGNNGGGVCVNGTFTMVDGSISENRSVAGGGGITAFNGAVTLTGGSITDNTITGKMGGGVLVHNGSLAVSGAPVVTGNTINGTAVSNVYLNAGKTINVSDTLAADALIGVSSKTVPTVDSPVIITGMNNAENINRFFSDNTAYACVAGDNGFQLVPAYSISAALTNLTLTGAVSVAPGTAYTATLVGANGYMLPDSITVKIGDNVLTSGYTYNSTTGILTIDAASVTDDIVITATGKIPVSTITFDAGLGSCATGSAVTIEGKLTTLPDASRDGYHFVGWFDVVEGGNPITVETLFLTNTTIYAQWTLKQHIVTFNASDDGTSATVITANYGEPITAPAAPIKEGYTFIGWADAAGNVIAAGNAYTISGDMTFTAVWEEIPAKAPETSLWLPVLARLYMTSNPITAIAGEGGAISDPGVTEVKYGRNHSYVITPDEGYIIADVLVNGKSVGAVSEYTFKKVRRPQTIEAIFAVDPDAPVEAPVEDAADPMYAYDNP